MSVGTLYGGYLHGLLHSPQQLAVSLSSTDSENLERLQGQARHIAEATTSRRPAEIVKMVLLWLQAESERDGDSMILQRVN